MLFRTLKLPHPQRGTVCIWEREKERDTERVKLGVCPTKKHQTEQSLLCVDFICLLHRISSEGNISWLKKKEFENHWFGVSRLTLNDFLCPVWGWGHTLSSTCRMSAGSTWLFIIPVDWCLYLQVITVLYRNAAIGFQVMLLPVSLDQGQQVI